MVVLDPSEHTLDLTLVLHLLYNIFFPDVLKVYSNIQKASNVMFYENIPSVYIFLGEVWRAAAV